MNAGRVFSYVARGLALGALAVVVPGLWTQEPPQPLPAGEGQSEGVEVLARGPVHEAFAEPAQSKPKPSPVIAKEAPEPIDEVPPDEKPDGEGVQWLPGYWAWDEDRDNFIWVSGFWRVPPPGRRWVPGHWNRVEGGWHWVTGFWALEQQEDVTYLPPPPEPLAVAPSTPAPDPDHVYINGCWVYRDGRYAWRSGFWMKPRYGWVWVPAHYVWSPAGYVFVEGYWDYTLRDRGLLFAPIYVDVAVVRRPGWYYSPCYVIHDDCLVTALFVRPGSCHYYFGDYFEPCHRRSGYVAWYEVHHHHHYHDPLFTYYRYHHRHTDGWEVSLRATYVGRYNGDIPRPPRTLVQQNTVVQNITVNNTTINNVNVNQNTANVKNVQVLTPLKQVDHKVVSLKPVAPEVRQAERASAQQLVQTAKQRSQAETQAVIQASAAKPAPGGNPAPPQPVKLNLPKPPANAGTVKTLIPGAGDAKAASKVPQPGTGEMRPAMKLDGKSLTGPGKVEAKAPPAQVQKAGSNSQPASGLKAPPAPPKPETKATAPGPGQPSGPPAAIQSKGPIQPIRQTAPPMPEKKAGPPTRPSSSPAPKPPLTKQGGSGKTEDKKDKKK